jgi:tRNA pseudouridine55 synthase
VTKSDAWPSGLVIIDKPGGMTSHDVVARVRRLARTRRVGHAGTLDPMATGVLVVGIEKATRLLGHLMLTEKTYHATIRLGQATSTDDAEGEPTWGSTAAGVTSAALDAGIAALTGEILQVPPGVSAIKVNGQRAYKLTRAGAAPELAARPVTVRQFSITGLRREGDLLDVGAVVRCSSGTYIRALARDLGTALGTGGHLTMLRRTAVGPYTIAMAHTLAGLEDQHQSPERKQVNPPLAAATPPAPHPPAPAPVTLPGLHPPPAAPVAPPGHHPPATATTSPAVIPLAEAAAAAFPRLDLTSDDARRLAQGARLPIPPAFPSAGGKDTPVAAFAPDGSFVALVEAADGRLRSLAVFACPPESMIM